MAAVAYVEQAIEDLIDAAFVDVECGNSHDGGAEQRGHRQLS